MAADTATIPISLAFLPDMTMVANGRAEVVAARRQRGWLRFSLTALPMTVLGVTLRRKRLGTNWHFFKSRVKPRRPQLQRARTLLALEHLLPGRRRRLLLQLEALLAPGSCCGFSVSCLVSTTPTTKPLSNTGSSPKKSLARKSARIK